MSLNLRKLPSDTKEVNDSECLGAAEKIFTQFGRVSDINL
jgi:hypothetical protein